MRDDDDDQDPRDHPEKALWSGEYEHGDWDQFDVGTRGSDRVASGEMNSRDDGLDDSAPASWVSQGGILRWEEPEDNQQGEQSDARSEAISHWAADTIDLPPGAPDHLRVRSLRAWLLRQRLLDTEALGQLLLDRRQNEQRNQDLPSSDEPEGSPLELAIAERQAAIEVFEALIESLDEMATHNGPARLLVEYYLWLNERLAFLATAAEAPLDFASRAGLAPGDPLDDNAGEPGTHQPESVPTARSIAEWLGRAQAALRARRRIEQVSAPEPEE